MTKDLTEKYGCPEDLMRKDRQKILKIDIELEMRHANEKSELGGGYLENYDKEQNSTVSSESEVVVESSQDYPAVKVHEYGDGESKIISYIRINRVAETNFTSTQRAEENVRKAEMDFMLDLQSIIKETAADPEILKVKLCLERDRKEQIPEEYKGVAKKLTTRGGELLVDDRIVVPKSLRSSALNSLHFGHPGITRMCQEAQIFWWPGMRREIENKVNRCTSCISAGKNLKFQIPKNEKKTGYKDQKWREKKYKWTSPENYTVRI